MRGSALVSSIVVALFVGGCGDDGGLKAIADGEVEVLSEVEVTPDVAADVASDVAVDTVADRAVDTAMGEVDSAVDTLDIAPDTAVEVALDADGAPDAEDTLDATDPADTLDTALDTEPDSDVAEPDCPPRTVDGTLTDDETWCGEVTIDWTVTVPAGVTLTIEPGTHVSGGALVVAGKVSAVGSAARPISFGGAGVSIRASGSLLEHVAISGAAQAALTVSHAVTLRDVHLSDSYYGLKTTDGARVTGARVTISDTLGWGILVGDVSAVTLTDLTIERAGKDGIYFTSHLPSSITGCRIVDSVANGIYVERGEPTLSDCTLSDNGQNGVLFESGKGSLTRSTVTGNGYEGVRIWVTSVAEVTRSNIHGNAKIGAFVVVHPALQAATTLEGSGEVVSATYATPHGELISHALLSVQEVGPQPWTTEGAIQSDNGAELIDFPEARDSEWYNVIDETSTLRAWVSDASPTNRIAITVSALVYFEVGAVRELTVVSNSPITAHTLWLGRFPDVGDLVGSGSRRSLFLGGLSGVPLDATFTLKPPYFGAQSFPNGLAWSGEVWVSGDVGVGTSFDVAPGTVVHVVRTGVYDVAAANISASSGAAVTLRGTAQAPITIASFGSGDGSGLGAFLVDDVSLTMRHVDFADGGYVQIHNGRGTIEDVTVRRMSDACVSLASATWLGGAVTDCGGNGFELGDRAVIDGVAVTGAANAGVFADGFGSIVRNCDLHDNGTGLALAGNDNPTASHNRIARNGVGVELFGDAAAVVSGNDIRDNDGEGVLVYPRAGATSFAPVVSGNNIVANGLRTPPVIAEPGLTFASNGTVGSIASEIWATPGGERIVLAMTSLFDTVHESALTASVEVPPTATSAAAVTLRTLSSYPALVAWDARLGQSDRVRFRFVTTAADVVAHALLRYVLYRAPGSGPAVGPVAVVGFINEGVVDFGGNYWGAVTGIDDLIHLAGPGLVDFADAASVPFADAGPL